MKTLHVKKGDTVKVISGSYKGKEGKVTKSLPKTGQVVVDGVNMAKKHKKPTVANQRGAVIEITRPISVSKVKKVS